MVLIVLGGEPTGRFNCVCIEKWKLLLHFCGSFVSYVWDVTILEFQKKCTCFTLWTFENKWPKNVLSETNKIPYKGSLFHDRNKIPIKKNRLRVFCGSEKKKICIPRWALGSQHESQENDSIIMSWNSAISWMFRRFIFNIQYLSSVSPK